MKTEIEIHKPEVKDFPALYQGESGAVVLMYASGQGVCLHSPRKNQIGKHSEDWFMIQFKRITSDVTITFKAGA